MQTIAEQIKKEINESKLSTYRKNLLIKKVVDPNLTVSQQQTIKLTNKKLNSVRGSQVRLVFDELGNPSSYNYTGVLLNTEGTGLRQVTIQWDEMVKGKQNTSTVWLFQIEFTNPDIFLTPKQIKDLVIENFVKQAKEKSKTLVANTKARIEVLDHDISDYKKYIERYEEEKKTLQGMTVEDKTFEKFEEELKLIKKIEQVDEVYISKQKNIIVKTKMLTIKWDGEEVELGRFVIKISPTDKTDVLMVNLDYCINSGYAKYYHPHLKNNATCWGNNGIDIKNMLAQGNIFALIDFIITFYTTYPQPTGSPHYPYDEWLESRSKHTTTDLLEEKAISI